MVIRILIPAPLMLIFALVMAVTINLRLSAVLFAAIPILGLV